MPSNLKKVSTHNISEGINTVVAPELMKNTQAKYILNCHSLSTGVGDVGVITNVKGNLSIPTTLPDGENKTIGTAVDTEKNLFYFFVFNSNGFHTIFQFNELTRTVISILQSKTDTGGIDVLNFSKDYLILMTNVVDNNLLYWVDGLNDARKINIKKCLDKSVNGYGASILEEYINAYKLAPSLPPAVTYFSDLSKNINRLYGSSRKFASIYGYDDRDRSVYSDFSSVVNPLKESFLGVNSIPTNNNGLEIKVQTGSSIVKTIEIAMFQPTADLPNPSWVTIAVLDKKKLNISDNSTYTYKFYNDGSGSYPTIADNLIEKPQSYLPKAPLCQAKVRNSITYANFNEGFEDVAIDVDLDVDYKPLFIESGAVDSVNSPYIVTSYPEADYLNSGKKWTNLDNSIGKARKSYRANSQFVTIGNDVKEGNVFYYTLYNGAHSSNFAVTADISDTALTIANKLKAQIVSTGFVVKKTEGNSPIEHYIYDNLDDGFGNITFKFIMLDSYKHGYFGSYGSVAGVPYSTLKDTGESKSNTKLGAGIKFGIMYEDFQGRRSLVYTNDDLIITTSTQNMLGGIKAPVFSLTIKHIPPIWAKSYQIVRTKDLTYSDFIQMVIQKVINVTATNSGGDYLDLVVGSLYTYQKIHPNTTLKYDFKKGDRIRLISKQNGSYYPDFETEILSYKDVTSEIINTNLTVNGTETVTVVSATDDNVGRFIIVGGDEREIIAKASSTTYTVNAPIGKSGQDAYLSYELVDRRGLLRIRKPSTISGITITKLSLVEIFSPSLSVDTLGQKQFYHFNKKFDIVNAGKSNRYHYANKQPQDATHDAIVEITEGTVYVRNREMPVTNTIPNAQVIIKTVEDESYSDFYYSNLNDNGRGNVEDNKQGVVHFGSRIRFSSIELENTAINGLNDFANLDRMDYNDAYGDIKLTVVSENGLLVFKELKDAIVQIFATIIQDNSGTELLGTSKKLLNDIRYYAHDGGIGNNPESYCRNEGQHYHVSANSGCYVRLSGDGVTPISQIYYFDNEARRLLTNATIQKANIYGEYDRLLGCVVWYIEGYDIKTFSETFNGATWEVLSPEILTPTQAIVDAPTHGTAVIVDGLVDYTPTTDYVGSDSFTYSTIVDGTPVIRKVCLNMVLPPNRNKAWRPKESSYVCVLNDDSLKTGYKSWTTLEEYYTDNGELTGNEKPNQQYYPDYNAPIYDDATCVVTATVYYSVEKSATAQKNDCLSGQVGSTETYTIDAGEFTSTISQLDADTKAQNAANMGAQSNANEIGTCTTVGEDYYLRLVISGSDIIVILETYGGDAILATVDITVDYSYRSSIGGLQTGSATILTGNSNSASVHTIVGGETFTELFTTNQDPETMDGHYLIVSV